MGSVRFNVGRLLLLLAALVTTGIGNVTGVSCNPADLEVDTNLTVNVNCSRFDPTYNYVLDEEFQYADTSNYNRFLVQYTCRTNSSLIDTTDGLLEVDPGFTWPIFDPDDKIVPTYTLPYTFTTGDECTFSGCYYTPDGSNTRVLIARAIQPTSCVVDLDECTSGANDCDEHAECTNTVGSYECLCTAGYTGDGKHCENIDECEKGTHSCSENAVCDDTNGSYNCSCLPGYDNEENEFNCTDINECVFQTHNCSDNVTCTNTDGGYSCSCNPGLEGDGFNCGGMCGDLFCDARSECKKINGSFACECRMGYEESGNGCTNIDECERDVHNCSFVENSLCEDVEGTFICLCQTGFYLNDSSCLNINECVEGTHDCSPHASCIDSDGSYNCRCSAGYDGDGFNCRIGVAVWVFGVGASTALVLAVVLTVLVCCIVHRRNKKDDVYQLFFKWKDELNPNFAPVSFEVSKMKLSPSVITTFDALEKFSSEEPFKGSTPDGNDEDTNASVESIPSSLSSTIPPTSKKENASMHLNLSAILNRVRSISSVSSVSPDDGLSLSSATSLFVSHQTSDYIKDTDFMSHKPQGRPVVNMQQEASPSGYLAEPIPATVQTPTALTASSEELEVCAVTLSGEQDEGVHSAGLTLIGHVPELLPMTAAHNPAANTTGKKDSQQLEKQHGALQSQITPSHSGYIEEQLLLPTVNVHNLGPHTEESQGHVLHVGKLEPSGYVEELLPMKVQCPTTIAESKKGSQSPCKSDVQSTLTSTPAGYVEEVLSTSMHTPTQCTANREDDCLLGNLYESGQVMLLPTDDMEQSLPIAREHANDCTIQESGCYVTTNYPSTDHTPTTVTKTIDVLMLDSDNTFIDTSNTETLGINAPCNLTIISTRSRVEDSCSSVSSGYMSYSSSLEGSDGRAVQLSIKDGNGYLQDINVNSSQSGSGYISTADTFHLQHMQ